MMLNADERAARLQSLIPILQCPRCQGALKLVGDELVSEGCAARYPVRDGVPVLLPEGMEELGEGTVSEADRVSRHPYSPASEELIEQFKGGWVLDLGAGGKLLRHPNVVQVDIFRYPATDVVASADTLPFRTAVFDSVLSQAVFEHLQFPEEAAAEIHRVLKPSGIAKIDTAFLQPEHGYPHHYFNATEMGLRHWFRGFELEWSGVEAYQHPKWSLSWFLGLYLSRLEGQPRERLGGMSFDDFLAVMKRHARGELLPSDVSYVEALDLLDPLHVRALAAGVSVRAVKAEGAGVCIVSKDSSVVSLGKANHLVLERRLAKLLGERGELEDAVSDGSARLSTEMELRRISADRARYLMQYFPGRQTVDNLGWLRWITSSAAGILRNTLPKVLWFKLRALYKGGEVSEVAGSGQKPFVSFAVVPDHPIQLVDQFFSLVHQTVGSWEYLLVEHPGQTPSVRRVMEDLARLDSRVTILTLPHSDRARALEAVPGRATGEYLAWVTSATIVAFAAVDELFNLARINPEAQLLCSDSARLMGYPTESMRCFRHVHADTPEEAADMKRSQAQELSMRHLEGEPWLVGRRAQAASVVMPYAIHPESAHVPKVLFREVPFPER